MLMMNLYLSVALIFCLTIESSAKECAIQKGGDLYNLQNGCTKIKGDVILTSQLPSNISLEWLERKLSSVTKITGYLLIYATNFTEIKFLRNLKTVEMLKNSHVEASSQGIVTIAYNQATTIDLSKLTAINASPKGPIPLIIMANKFCLEEATAIRLAQLFAVIADTQICNPSKVHCIMSGKSKAITMFIGQNLPDGCQIIHGGILLNGDGTDEINSKLSTIELLSGFIFILGNPLTTLNFTSLTHIVNTLGISFPSLGIAQNEKLESLLIPNLKSIKSASPVYIQQDPQTGEESQIPTMFIAKNPSLSLDAQTCGIFSSIAKVNKLKFMTQENAQTCSGSESGPDLSGVQEYTVPKPGSGGGKVVLVKMITSSGSNGDYSSEPGDNSSEPGFIKSLSTLTPLSLSILLAYLFF